MEEYKITKERLKAMAEECPEAGGILKKGFPEAFKDEWVDITGKLEWAFRKDMSDGFGVLRIDHDGIVIGHLWVDGEFFFTDDNYRVGLYSRNFRILKRQNK